MRRTTVTGFALLAFVFTACGTGGPSGGSARPEILAIVPASGAVGVRDDANIRISFSQPMDRASVEAAYVSFADGLRRDQVAFVWNANSTLVTVDPKGPLSYAAAPAAPVTYTFLIGASAQAQGGGKLAETTSSFRTARRYTTTLNGQAALDGYTSDQEAAYSNGVTGGTSARVGGMSDIAPSGYVTVSVRGFFSFDLSSLPPGLLPEDVSSAALTLQQTLVYPASAYTDMSTAPEQLVLEHVRYGDRLNIKSFSAPVLDVVSPAFSKDAALGARQADVTAAVRADLQDPAASGGRTQYRLRFGRDGVPGAYGFAEFGTAEDAAHAPALQLGYLAP
ncbi:Ig-like domain-containing protein [Deinococcus sonorensis]|uniref:Ig-like domain-containing protein n=2 Tax=Deinococcus sonorensis TaxID=309891 RepID=A0AAU7UG42_9DEIO